MATTTPPSESTLESRLFKRLDAFMTEIKEAFRTQDQKIDKQGEKLDRLAEDRVTRDEYDALRRRVDMQATDVAVHGNRLSSLEGERNAEDTSRRQRPFSTWQLVVGTVALLATLSFDLIMALVSVANLVILLKK